MTNGEMVIKIVGDLGGKASKSTASKASGGTSLQQGAHMVADISKGSIGALGAAIGSIFGPGGTAIGAMVGGIVDSALPGLSKVLTETMSFIFLGPYNYVLKKALDNSELAKGIKKMAKEGWGVLGDTLLFGIWKIWEQMDTRLERLIEVGKAPVWELIIKPELEEWVDNTKTILTGALELANMIKDWGTAKFIELFNSEEGIKIRELISAFGNIKLRELFDGSVAFANPLDVIDFYSGLDVRDLFRKGEGLLGQGDIFKFGEGGMTHLFVDEVIRGGKLKRGDLFDFGLGKDSIKLSDLIDTSKPLDFPIRFKPEIVKQFEGKITEMLKEMKEMRDFIMGV